jgi:hypothetical protein
MTLFVSDPNLDTRLMPLRFNFCATLALCLSLCCSTAARAQDAATDNAPAATTTDGPVSVVSHDANGRLVIRATRLTAPMVIDGRIQEEAYGLVQPITDLVQQDPDPGAPISEKTEVWVFFDDTAVYVSARCWDSHPERAVVNDLRRDGSLGQQDHVNLGLDTYHDLRNGAIFGVTSAGGLNDGLGSNERDYNRDWNGVWDARTSTFEGGWSVEYAIPFKSLRYAGGGEQVWGINLRRGIRWKNEYAYLTPIPPSLGLGGMQKFSSAATLVGLDLPQPRAIAEVKPYVIGGRKTERLAASGLHHSFDKHFGFDTKYGVTPSLTADFTYNTDFAQVEDDEQQVNLTRFSLFFPEKREFFLENQGIFNFGGYGQRRGGTPGDMPLLFFSRRIGLSRDGQPVPIIAGGRLSGKAGRYNVGVLNIQTDDDLATASRSTNFTVVRVSRDILRRSMVGAYFTRRSESAVVLDGVNTAYAMDGVFSFFTNLNINSYIARTSTTGMDGEDFSGRGQLDYNADRYGVQLERMVVQKNFNPEIGYTRRVDFSKTYAMFRFSPRPKRFAAVKKFAYEGSYDRYVNSSDVLETRTTQGTFRTEFKNSDILHVQVTNSYEFLPRPFVIFGGVTVPVGGYEFTNLHTQYDIGAQRPVSGSVALDTGQFYDGTKQTLAYSTGRVVLTSNFAVEPSVSINWVDIPQGTFTAKVITARTIYTFTPRMYFGGLVQYNSTSHSLSSNLRLRWEYRPGSELFVGYNDGRDTAVEGSPELLNRAFVVKTTYLFRR